MLVYHNCFYTFSLQKWVIWKVTGSFQHTYTVSLIVYFTYSINIIIHNNNMIVKPEIKNATSFGSKNLKLEIDVF